MKQPSTLLARRAAHSRGPSAFHAIVVGSAGSWFAACGAGRLLRVSAVPPDRLDPAERCSVCTPTPTPTDTGDEA